MNIEDFIFNYLDTGVYDGNFPEEETLLLRVAGAYYQYQYNGLSQAEKDFGGWASEVNIDVSPGREA